MRLRGASAVMRPTKTHDDKRRTDAERIELMVRAAELYHEFGMTQEQVAAHLGVSRPTVSRLLAKAREEGVVRITVVNPASRIHELERRLVDAYGLHDAVVVPTAISRRELIARKLGAAGARYLERHLPAGVRLGVGLGHTVYQVAHALDAVDLKPVVIPLTGGIGVAEAVYQVNEIAREFAEKLNGRCYYLHAPAEISNPELYDALMADPRVVEVVTLWDDLDWAVVGIGSTRNPQSPYFQEFIRSVQETGARPVADLCRNLVDEHGTCVNSRSVRLLAASLEQFHKARRVVAIAGGTAKVEAIRAALRTGVIDVMITDELAAAGVLSA